LAYFNRKCGELLTLKPVHIHSKRNIVILKNAKGQKDRIVPLSPKILEMLRNYYKVFRPTTYLFEGQRAGMTYDSRSLQLVLKQALKKAELQNLLLYIGSDTVMRRIFWKVELTCVIFKNY